MRFSLPKFTDKNEAFKWFLDNIYPGLPTEDKKSIWVARDNFVHKGSISEKKVIEILGKYGHVKREFIFIPNSG